MRINQFTKITGRRAILVPYEAQHVPRYQEWMRSEELQELTGSEPLTLPQEYEMQQSWREDENKCTFIVLDADIYNENTNELDSMVGDVNFFFNEDENKSSAEIEIMIADKKSRGRGLGKEALLAMMSYGIQKLGLQRITAKIGLANNPSIKLFTKIGFREISRSDVFQEITFELNITRETSEWILKNTEHLTVEKK